jgi:hypothetical protein
MWYIVAIVIAAVGLVLGLISMVKAGPVKEEITKNREVDHRLRPVTPPDSINGSYTREEIAAKLKKLAKSPAPTTLKPGAMCYAVAGPPARAEYVCPVCGEKTLYTDGHTFTIQYELPSCRQIISSIKGLEIKLDETQYCKKCHPEVESPSLCLEIKYSGEDKPYVCCNVGSSDVDLVYEFISGNKKHTGGNGQETPLKDYTARLEELLGVTIK